YHHPSYIVDVFYSLVISLHMSRHLRESVRRFFMLHPPSVPLCSHDYFWVQDTPANRCQIIGLCVLKDRLDLATLRSIVAKRWLHFDIKLTSVLSHVHGR